MGNQKEYLLSNLQRIQKNKYMLNEGEMAWDYVPLMLQYIGDIDPELRDDLIYNTFCQWIYEKELFSSEQLVNITDILMDESHLFFHIGDEMNETVFTRTFSVLVIVLILAKHREKPFLDNNRVTKVRDSIIRYYNEEKDLRGYLGDTGWAHGAAHGADAMCELVASKEINEIDILNILDALKHVLYNEKYFLSNEEDERMTRVVFIIIMKKLLPEQSIKDWIESLLQCVDREYSREQYISRVNTKNLVRCLYFSLMHQKNTTDITNAVFAAEEKLNRFIRVDKELLNEFC